MQTTREIRNQLLDKIKQCPEISEYFDIISDYVKLTAPLTLRCKKDGYEFTRQARSLKRGRTICPACGNGSNGKLSPHMKVIRGINDLWTTHPYIAKLLVNPEDGYKYSAHNTVKLKFECPYCGNTEGRWLYYVTQTMPYCKKCGDSRSYLERLMSAVLRNLGVEFETEKTFDWCKFELKGKQKSGRYDFYFELNGHKYLIEMHGDQHINESAFTRMSIKDIWYIDITKAELAEENGYTLISIYSQVSDLENVKYEICESILSEIFDLSKVDWIKCQLETITSPMVMAADLWNNGMKSTSQIAKEIDVERCVARRYLKECAANGLCDYTVEEAKEIGKANTKKAMSKRIVLVNTGEVFDSMTEAGHKYKTPSDKIGQVCNGNRFYSGKLNGTPLVWRFENDVQGRDLKILLIQELDRISDSKINQLEGLQRGLLARHARNKI